jgi:hypothetical protein
VDYLSLGVAFAGALIAIAIPIAVERLKRPDLAIVLGDDLNIGSPLSRRLVHITVINRPLTGVWGRFLLRNTATGCSAHVTIQSRTGGTSQAFHGRWSGQPEPLTIVGTPVGLTLVYDPTKLPQSRLIDVSPGLGGQGMAIAIKADGDQAAYAFASESYEDQTTALRRPGWELPERGYDVIVEASAGGLTVEARFRLRNEGSSHEGLGLEPTA